MQNVVTTSQSSVPIASLNTERIRKVLIIIWAFAYAFLLTMPTEFFPVSERIPRNDTAVYQYMGYLITQGKMPYVAGFDHKGPLVYLIYALAYIISPRIGVWILNLLCMFGILIFSYLIGKKFAGSLWSVIICTVIFSDFYSSAFIGSSPEFYATFFASLALLLISSYYKSGDIGKVPCILLGVCFAGMFFLKHTTMITALFICFLIICNCVILKKYRNIPTYDAYIEFNLLYAGNDGVTAVKRAGTFLFLALKPSVVISVAMIFASLIAYLAPAIKGGQASGRAIAHGALALLVSLLLLCSPGRDYGQYLTSLFPLCVFICAAALAKINEVDFQYSSAVKALCVILIMCTVVAPNLKKVKDSCSWWWTEIAEDAQLVDDVNQYALDGDTITVHGFFAYGVYLATGHESASKYYFTSSLVDQIPGSKEEYLSEIKESQPAVILCRVDENESSIFGRDILSNYYLRDTTENYHVYVRKDRMTFDKEQDKLKSIIDIESYLTELSTLQDCTIYFSVKDVPGRELTTEMIETLNSLGLKDIDTVLDRKYHTFLGIVRNGKVEYELVGPEGFDYYDTELDGHEIHMESKTFLCGNKASIEIDGTEYALNKRGLNIVVFSNSSDEVIDSVNFDTHDEYIRCYRN